MSKDTPAPPTSQSESLAERSLRLQIAYEASRRNWAQAVGRPYDGDPDLRPPPGELDATAED